MCSAWSGKLNGNRIEEAGWFENVEHVHLFLIPMRLFYKHIYGGFLCLFVCFELKLLRALPFWFDLYQRRAEKDWLVT